uniref:Protein phosphatase 4, regulatory subunit 2b n=1 Tax=Lates calcarifer TaxID=8187 RepID=A0A4W6FWR2_LATCA
MEIDSLQEALRDFDKKSKKEASPLLEQFLCHIAKTGETIIPFTIQRLCELLTEPKRNYTGTDKFLRGVEKVCLSSVDAFFPMKNGCNAVNRMNGVMLPGNTSAFTERLFHR